MANSKSRIILFDMETTGLDKMVDQVCQISAVPLETQVEQADIFNVYILPSRNFDPEASKINGFYIVSENESKKLYKQGKSLPTVSLQEAYTSFFKYLENVTLPGSRIILTGYNSKSFDISFLRRDCHKHGISVKVKGRELCFADAYLLIRAIRSSVLPGIESLSQRSVHKYLYPQAKGEDFPDCPQPEAKGDFHDGVDDALILRDILNSPKIPLEQLSQHEFDCFPRKPASNVDRAPTEQDIATPIHAETENNN